MAYWRRIFIATALTTVAAFGFLGGFQTSVAWPHRAKSLAIIFLYANCIGVLMGVVMPGLSRWVPCRTAVRRWTVRGVAIVSLTVTGCAVAAGVLVAIGACSPGEYFQELRSSLGTAIFVATAGSLTLIAYETLRSELEEKTVALRTKERDEAEARRLAAEAQLSSIESRVQPHFLFNTLNSIAALVHDDPAGAERMTEQLASLMRSALDTSATPLVPIEHELTVIRDYLAIERVRFGRRLRYQLEVDRDAATRLVPRMSLQTLVENSVKYAVSPRREGASITVRAHAADGRLTVAVEDDGPGFDQSSRPSGHGLALLASRLAMLFGDRATLSVNSRPGRTAVTLELPA
jgi:sensor histidine kinase YesM